MNNWYWFIPVLTAFTGFVGNKIGLYIFLKKTNRPENEGNVPEKKVITRQAAWAESISAVLTSELPITGSLSEIINNPAHFEKLRPLIENQIDDFLRNRLKVVFPVISMFIGDKTIGELKSHFMVELDQLFPQVISQYAGSVADSFEPRKMIQEKLETLDIPLIIGKHLKNELRMFQIWGAIVGFVCGLITLLLIVITK